MHVPTTPTASTHPGWYPDPWGPAGQWRWWAGTGWTANTAVSPRQARKPRLPAWLSPPIVIAALLMVPLLLLTAITAPLAVPLGLVPILLVAPALMWLDRVEPEPWPARIHALLWGAIAATGVAIIVNSIADLALGETFSTVVSAPLVEEAMKALAVVWAVRRHEVDGVMDGVIHAGWAALGFAVVEDMLYFAAAVEEGDLVVVFVVRAVLSPFAHPLFTAWIGMGIGWAVRTRRGVLRPALAGYVLAVGFHALWNGSLVNAGNMGGELFLLVTAVIFVVLFLTVAVVFYRLRRKEERRFVELVPWLAQRYRMMPAEVEVFGHFRQMLRARRRLPRADRRRFDAVHAALARLALLHDRPGGADQPTESRLLEQLTRARSG